MKKTLNYLVIAVFAISAAFMSCDKNKDDDNNGNGNGNGNTGNSFVIEAKDVIGGHGSYNDIVTVRLYNLYRVSAKFENNGFKLTLPALESDELVIITQRGSLLFEGSLESLTISDREAKIKTVFVEAYNAENNLIGYIHQLNGSDGNIIVYYSYLDSDVTIKGEANGADFDLSFKKGWNMWYIGNNRLTTQKPSGVDFKWYYVN